MKKFFVVSDIHGFYDEFKTALDTSGFKPNDPNHYLISLGDNFDRGPDNRKVMEYLMSLERCILVRGNHEDLMEDMIARGGPQWHDYSNGTVDTAIEFSKSVEINQHTLTVVKYEIQPFFDSMINYFETKQYVFVHGWFPAIRNGDSDWRNAHTSAWKKARWYNGMKEACVLMNLDPQGKTVVCGHYHTSWGRSHLNDGYEWGPNADFSPFYDTGIIAIDACTAYSHKVNVLVLEDEFMEVTE